MIIVGIDEVGRGCWAGPVVAGAVILDHPLDGIKDSKLLSRQQRESWAEIIAINTLSIGLGWVSAEEVDAYGLTKAIRRAMRQALEQINVPYDAIIIDGNYNFLADNPKTKAVIKADVTEPAVSAASIMAKVARDKYMYELAKKQPDYGFEHHVGYGTAMHYEKLMWHGVTDEHRKSYKPIREILLQLAA
jgi:ribonuclease HII